MFYIQAMEAKKIFKDGEADCGQPVHRFAEAECFSGLSERLSAAQYCAAMGPAAGLRNLSANAWVCMRKSPKSLPTPTKVMPWAR